MVAALVLGAALIGTTPSPAVGCTLGEATLDTALVQGVRFLFVAAVVDVSADRTYRLRTERVFQGSVPESLTLAPQPGGGINTCDAALDAGVTYVFGMNDFQGAISLGEVWFQLEQGRVVGSNFITLPTDDARELKALLSRLSSGPGDTGTVPDTALPAPPPARGHSIAVWRTIESGGPAIRCR